MNSFKDWCIQFTMWYVCIICQQLYKNATFFRFYRVCNFYAK